MNAVKLAAEEAALKALLRAWHEKVAKADRFKLRSDLLEEIYYEAVAEAKIELEQAEELGKVLDEGSSGDTARARRLDKTVRRRARQLEVLKELYDKELQDYGYYTRAAFFYWDTEVMPASVHWEQSRQSAKGAQ